jgi:hypothetical protein
MKKDELIQYIAQNSELSQEELKTKKISELKDISNQITMTLKSNTADAGTPSEHDPEWSNFVMSNFAEDELREGMPTCDGLRRVFKKLIGDILSCEMTVVKSPTSSDQTSTVKCSIVFSKRGSVKERFISDVFDVNPDNTPWPYCKSSVGTAATKAEARALRKALGLVKVYSAEEIQEGMNSDEIPTNQDGSRQISDSAKIAINTMCNRLSVKPAKLFSFMGLSRSDVSELTYSESHAVLAKLNAFTRGEANGGESVPDQIKSTEMIF